MRVKNFLFRIALIFSILRFSLFSIEPVFAVTSTPRPTSTPRNTPTPRNTSTPRPTATPKNTPTPKPTATTTPVPVVNLSVVPADLSFTGTNLKGGSPTTLKAVVRNSGNTKATNFKVKFFVNDLQVYEKTISSLNKNSKTTVSYSYKIPANVSSSVVFKVALDPDKTASITIPVIASSYNLILESLKSTSNNPKPGQKITWVIKVKNAGNAKAAQVKIALFADKDSQTPTSALIIPSINSGDSTSKNISWTVPLNLSPALNYPIRAVVDPDNTIPESNETDNAQNYSLSLTVPDLSIEKGEYFNATGVLYPNTFQQINVKVKNDNITAVSGAKVGVYYSLSQTGTRTKLTETALSLAKKANTPYMFDRVALPNNIPLGTLVYIFITVDGDNAIPESNENNNEITMQRTIIERPPQAQVPYIFVTVRDEDSNSKNGVIVKLTDVNQPSNIKTKTTGSDILTQNRAGTVVFDNLPNTGKYTISISASGYRAQTNTFDYDKYDDQTVYRDFDLDKKAALTGTVKNSSGTPLKDVRVIIDGLNLETTTDSEGKYGFMLNGGTYSLRFVKKDYARIIENNLNVPAISTITLDKAMSTAATAYTSGLVTDDEGNGLSNVDIYTNNNMVAVTANDGHFTFNNMSPGSKTFKFKKPGYVDTEFTETIEAGEEYNLTFVMYKPSTDNHVERGTEIVSWHQHEGTPANSFWVPEYNVDVWWGLARTKMALDFTKTGDSAKLTKLVINNHGNEWECNKVEGSGDVETSAIDIPVTISAGSCSNKKTQMDVYKVAIESDGQEVWSDDSFWTSAGDPLNTGTKTYTFNNLSVNWNNNFEVKMWVRVQKRAVIGTDGDGAGALVGYHLDKKLITWHPQKPPTTVISTSWGQVGNYLLGILDNPVTAITDFTDLFTVKNYNTYTMSEVLPADFPGSPPEN